MKYNARIAADRTLKVAWRKMSDQLWEGLIGVMVGALARFALPGRNPGGLLLAVAVGVAGSYLAIFTAERIGWYQDGGTTAFAWSAAGAIILVAIFRFLTGTTAKSSRGEEDRDL